MSNLGLLRLFLGLREGAGPKGRSPGLFPCLLLLLLQLGAPFMIGLELGALNSCLLLLGLPRLRPRLRGGFGCLGFAMLQPRLGFRCFICNLLGLLPFTFFNRYVEHTLASCRKQLLDVDL